MDIAGLLLRDAKEHARIDFNDDDANLELILTAAAGDVLAAAGMDRPEDPDDLPYDLRFAIIDQAAMIYDARANVTTRDRPLGLSLAASRITARYRGVSTGALCASQDGSNDGG